MTRDAVKAALCALGVVWVQWNMAAQHRLNLFADVPASEAAWMLLPFWLARLILVAVILANAGRSFADLIAEAVQAAKERGR